MKTAAIYARVSSDKQKEENTIASQTAALTAFATEQGYAVAPRRHAPQASAPARSRRGRLRRQAQSA
jgi:DNA invertase Pin-like site-specific DNA recombinase